MTATDRRMIARLSISDFDLLERQARDQAAQLQAEIDLLTVAGICLDVVAVNELSAARTAAIQRAERFASLGAWADDDADGTYEL